MPLAALAALGGAYSISTLPLLAASVAVFLLTRARVAHSSEARLIDVGLIAALAVIVLQLVPLPAALADALSPKAAALRAFLAIDASAGRHPLSIDWRLTRQGLATAASAALLFWAARHTLATGGARRISRIITWSGGAVALLALAQRATAPDLLLWQWKPLDPGAQPFGPFVNRNHFATWLLLAISLASGYLIAHLRSHRLDLHTSRRLVVRDVLADGWAMLAAAAVGVMLLALVATLSRAALMGLAAALLVAATGVRGRRADRAITIASVAMVLLLAGALWVNREGLVRRVESRGDSEPGRTVIWSETMPLVTDFWLTGTGVGTYGSAMLQYQRTRTGTLFNQAHNEYLQILAEGGVLLAAAAAVVLFGVLRLGRVRLAQDSRESGWIRLGAAAGLCGVAVQSVFEAGLRMPANAFLAAVLAAIVVAEPRVLGAAEKDGKAE